MILEKMKWGLGSGPEVKRDWFSDLRDNTLDSIGITQDVRESLQPVVDQAAQLGGSLLPSGGQVPPNTQGIAASEVVSNALNGVNTVFMTKIGGVPVMVWIGGIVGLAFLIGRKRK